MRAPVACRECGTTIRIPAADGLDICDHCRHPLTPSVGNGHEGHYDDDPSGASGSWDRVVRLYEEATA